MKKKRNSEPFNIEDVKFTTDASPENNTPEKIEQRPGTLIEIAIEIAGRQGLLRGRLTEEASRERRRRDVEEERVVTPASYRPGKVKDFETVDQVQKEIRLRLPQDKWGQIVEESHKLRITPTELARRWVLEGLSRRI